MNGFVDWMGAQADESYPPPPTDAPQTVAAQTDNYASKEANPAFDLLQTLPAHNFPAASPPEAQPNAAEPQAYEDSFDRNPHLWRYRDRTVALLRRYMRLALETGRLPSFIGREMFRARVTRYTATSFEDRVIFVHDVEGCLLRLDPFDQGIITRLILQEHDHDKASRLLHCARKTIERRLPELLDELTEQFLELKLLAELP
jgi:hypothetical protein